MPMPAQDRMKRGPFAALLILLSLVLGSASASAASDIRAPGARPGSNRHGATAALFSPGTRNAFDDEVTGDGPGPALAPSAPAIVTQALWARPAAEVPVIAPAATPRPAAASYRARAPPAS